MEEKDKRRIVIEVSEDARARLKAVAARRRLTMRELIDDLSARAEQETFGAAPLEEQPPLVHPTAARGNPGPVKPSRPGIDDFVGRTMDFEEFIKQRRGARGQ